MIETVVTLAARRIDQLRLLQERYAAQLREEEMLKLTAESELRALRAQINPHFLFNALTTIGYLIDAAPSRAMNTLLELTALLRGVLRSDGEFTTLGRELDLIEHYIKIEQERFEERLVTTVQVPASLRMCRVPALVLQPLVENAIKHGVASSRSGGTVDISAGFHGDVGDRVIRLTVRNTGTQLRTTLTAQHDHHGLDNIRRRLAGYYGSAATLELFRRDDGSTVAQITLPFHVAHQDLADDRTVANRTGRR
jgi:LytS/YehU family sensor histidine kinase